MSSAQSSWSLSTLYLMTASLAACSGQLAGGDADPAQPVTGAATGPEAFTPAQVQAARTQCNEPHGPVVAPSTVGQLDTMITGAWLLCSAEGDPGFTDSIGSSRVYSANGQWQNLGLDANGGLVLINGVDNQGTWNAGNEGYEDGPDGSLTGPGNLEMQWDNGGGNGGSVAFETSPQRMQFQPDYDVEWYVPLP